MASMPAMRVAPTPEPTGVEYFDGRNIECPLPQGLFDACTGAAKAAPATRPLKMHEVRVDGGMVQITSGTS